MYSDYSILVDGVNKVFKLYANPKDRVRQIFGRARSKIFHTPEPRYYREHRALADISFSLKPGETVGIIGKNGSGKSTLLQIVCGTLSATSGNVSILGRVAALLELGSGFNPDYSGRENLYLNASILGLSREEIAAREEKIIQFADIGIHIDEPVRTYSSGMTVRLAFSIIAHVDADILVIDEALAVGDAFFTQKCMRFLREFMKKGTVLFVSHDTTAVSTLCNRVIWLDKGKIVIDGDPKSVCEEYLQHFYESLQGSETSQPKTQGRSLKLATPASEMVDQRAALLNASNLRNDLEVISLDFSDQGFGNGDAEITAVHLLDNNLNRLAWVIGGERCVLRIEIKPSRLLTSPIVGFEFKNKFGQILFSDNTYLSFLDEAIQVRDDELLVVEFEFNMPRIPSGDYTFGAAIAEGTIENHVQLHWIHDAIHLRSEFTSVVNGLVGIPMLDIRATGTSRPPKTTNIN